MAQSNPPGGPAQGLAKILGAMADKQRQKQAQGEAQPQDIGAITQMIVHKPNTQQITDSSIRWVWFPTFSDEISVTATYYKEDREDGVRAGEYLVELNLKLGRRDADVQYLVFNPMDAGELGAILKAAHEWQHLWTQFAGEFLLVKSGTNAVQVIDDDADDADDDDIDDIDDEGYLKESK